MTTGLLRLLLAAFLAAPVSAAFAAAGVEDARSLSDSWAAVRDKLSGSPFGRPLLVSSQEESSSVRGDVHAVIEQPLEAILPVLRSSTRWCEILLLHLNVKDCQLRGTEADAVLSVAVGRRYDQALDSAQRIVGQASPATGRVSYTVEFTQGAEDDLMRLYDFLLDRAETLE